MDETIEFETQTGGLLLLDPTMFDLLEPSFAHRLYTVMDQLGRNEDDAEAGQRHDGTGDEAGGQAGPERVARADPLRVRLGAASPVVGHARSLAVGPASITPRPHRPGRPAGRGGSRRRGP